MDFVSEHMVCDEPLGPFGDKTFECFYGDFGMIVVVDSFADIMQQRGR